MSDDERPPTTNQISQITTAHTKKKMKDICFLFMIVVVYVYVCAFRSAMRTNNEEK